MSKNKPILIICIFLTVATLAAFWQVNNCDFTNYDDPYYITKNDHVQNGITIEGIRWALTTVHVENWHPLTWISHLLDVQLFGLQPRWHHLTNLVFHIANTLLLFFVLYRMTKAHWESAFVAALFALHPLHVESVAWVAERKDVLSTFFWMLTMGAYCYYVERPKLQRYLIVVLFFALGLMAKPMLVTLPFVLVLLDYWPFQRFQLKKSALKIRTALNKQKGQPKKKHMVVEEVKAEKPADSVYQWGSIRPLLWEKIPLIALAALSSIVTYIVQQKGGAVSSFETVPLSVRIANAFISYITYIGKTIWPNDLTVLYPLSMSLPTWQVVGAVLLLMTITIVVIWKARKIPYALVGWLWYAGTLVPVIGIVQVGLQARADRYTYLPLIGLFIMVVWGVSDLSKNWRYRKQVLVASSTGILICCGIISWTQVQYWQNSITLFEHALRVTDNNYTAYYNRGTAYADLGNYRQAIEDYDKVVEINPKYKEAYNNRGNASAILGNYRQAIGDYDKAIEINPKDEKAYNNRGNAYLLLGNDRQAIGDYNMAIEINPKYTEVYFNRGHAYSNLGNYRQAIEDFDKGIEINPNDEKAFYNRGNAYWHLGNYGQAIEDMKIAARSGHKNAQDFLKSKGIGW
jgi:protein O-mannosyl-transferase